MYDGLQRKLNTAIANIDYEGIEESLKELQNKAEVHALDLKAMRRKYAALFNRPDPTEGG